MSPFLKALLPQWHGEPWWARTLVKWPGRVTGTLEKVSGRSTHQGVHGWGVTRLTIPCSRQAGFHFPVKAGMGNCPTWVVGPEGWDKPPHRITI